MNSISVYYLVHLGYAYVVHLGWETNSKVIIIYFFIKLKQSSACYHYFWIHPLVVTITLDFCMLSLHNLTIFFSYACQILYTVMLNMQRKKEEFCVAIPCHADIAPWYVQWQTLPTPLQIVIQRKISVLRRIQTPLTTPIYPPRCLL